MIKPVLFLLLLLHCILASGQGNARIDFRVGSDRIDENYANNKSETNKLSELVSLHEDVILTGNGHLRLVANIPVSEKENLAVINLGALRASIIQNRLRQKFRMLTQWNFSFYINPSEQNTSSVEISYIPSPQSYNATEMIYYTKEVNNPVALESVMKQYGGIPYLNEAWVESDHPTLGEKTDKKATDVPPLEPVKGKGESEDVLIAIYYRWDKSNLDMLYLSNQLSLQRLDEILSYASAHYIDSLNIVAYASPEGNSKHNQDLSEWRAETIKQYILKNYPRFSVDRVHTEARGENWQGVVKFAEADPGLPSKEKVLEILKSNLSNSVKQRKLTKLENGRVYYRYILPNYYRYLRNGASILIKYQPDKFQPIFRLDTIPSSRPNISSINPYSAVYPGHRFIPVIALRTNLLYDLIGAANLGIEIPMGKHFSFILDGAYAYWRSSNNLFALQTLESGVEARYWFGVSNHKVVANENWGKRLKGWNLGIYGRYWRRYDVQFIDGYQGDRSWSTGLTFGYAFPIARQLSLEASLGAGWVNTSEYRHYHRPEYNKAGKGHLMWQQTGNWKGMSITKLRFSLVWLIEVSKKGGNKL